MPDLKLPRLRGLPWTILLWVVTLAGLGAVYPVKRHLLVSPVFEAEIWAHIASFGAVPLGAIVVYWAGRVVARPQSARWPLVAAAIGALIQLADEFGQAYGGLLPVIAHPSWWQEPASFVARVQGTTFDWGDVATILLAWGFTTLCMLKAHKHRQQTSRHTKLVTAAALVRGIVAIVGVSALFLATGAAAGGYGSKTSSSGSSSASGPRPSAQVLQIGEREGCSSHQIRSALDLALEMSANEFGSIYDDDLTELWGVKEGTGFCIKAYDPLMTSHGHAWGIPQALDGLYPSTTTWSWRHNARPQIRWGLSYIASRYRDPGQALDHEYSYGWY